MSEIRDNSAPELEDGTEMHPALQQQYDAGYKAACEQLRHAVNHGIDYVLQDQSNVVDKTQAQYIAETVAWAKQEMPMLKDAVDERLQGHPQVAADRNYAQDVLLLAAARFFDRVGSNEALGLAQRIGEKLEFYSQQFQTMLQGHALLTSEQQELPPIARGLAALQHLMAWRAEADAAQVHEDTCVQLWAAAANMMNEALVGQPEAAEGSIELLERFRLYLHRIQDEAWRYRDLE